MSRMNEISIDREGRIVLPIQLRQQLHLTPGMLFVVEEGTNGGACLRLTDNEPFVVEKQGVLVVRANSVGNIEHAVRNERDRRLSELERQSEI